MVSDAHARAAKSDRVPSTFDAGSFLHGCRFEGVGKGRTPLGFDTSTLLGQKRPRAVAYTTIQRTIGK